MMVRVPRSGPKCPKGTEARRGANTQATACPAASAFRNRKKTRNAGNECVTLGHTLIMGDLTNLFTKTTDSDKVGTAVTGRAWWRMGAGGEEAWQNHSNRIETPPGAMKDRRVPVADDAVRLAVGPGPSQKYPEFGDPRPGPARKGQEILKVSAGRLTREEEPNHARGRVGI